MATRTAPPSTHRRPMGQPMVVHSLPRTSSPPPAPSGSARRASGPLALLLVRPPPAPSGSARRGSI
eukprot:12477961-Heterocapsa_arctica.AAC.1